MRATDTASCNCATAGSTKSRTPHDHVERVGASFHRVGLGPPQRIDEFARSEPSQRPRYAAPMSADRLPILIADDQRDVLEALRLLLKSENHACQTVGDPAAAIAAAKKSQYSVALIDLNYTRDTTSGSEGLELLKALKRADPDLPVVVMTAWGTVNVAVEAMRLGAGD